MNKHYLLFMLMSLWNKLAQLTMFLNVNSFGKILSCADAAS